jgi:hypothetical protein
LFLKSDDNNLPGPYPCFRGSRPAVYQYLSLPQQAVYERKGMFRKGLAQNAVKPAPVVVLSGKEFHSACLYDYGVTGSGGSFFRDLPES